MVGGQTGVLRGNGAPGSHFKGRRTMKKGAHRRFRPDVAAMSRHGLASGPSAGFKLRPHGLDASSCFVQFVAAKSVEDGDVRRDLSLLCKT